MKGAFEGSLNFIDIGVLVFLRLGNMERNWLIFEILEN
jgi:hypothetical protein